MTTTFYVYILQCSDGTFYKGITNNLNKRLHQHELGQNIYTKHHLPLKLIHAQPCLGRLQARRLEKYFKSGFGREIINELAGMAELVYA